MNGGVNKNLISTKIREFHIDWVVVLSPVIVTVIVIAVISTPVPWCLNEWWEHPLVA